MRSVCFQCMKQMISAAILLVGPLGSGSGAAVAPERVDDAIERAKRWIYNQQHEGGHWEQDELRIGTDHDWQRMQGDTYGGYTALATYALLAAGENPNNPRVKTAIEFLKRCDMVGMYAIGVRCQVWLLIPHDSTEIRALIHKDADALFRGINYGRDNPDNKGLWDYLGKGIRVDHSVSQYGVLGLWACQQTGVVDVGADRWKLFEQTWRRDQQEDGGWNYGTQNPGPTPSMTAAGVATLFITSDYLHTEEGIGCTGNPPNPWIEKGLKWMDAHFDEIGDNSYTMYGMERIGAASGFKFFGSHDWYNQIAQRLVTTQHKDGSWPSPEAGSQPLDSTCFALLFMARGRAAVLMNKLDYHIVTPVTTRPVQGNWNERPRDLANLAGWAGHQTEQFFNWQIVNLAARPEDLHDAPILYLSGNEVIQFTDEDAQRLKTFVEQGGMILGNADCGKETFIKSFQELGKSLFGYEFRELPSAHPIYTHQQFNAGRWLRRPQVLAMSNGVRELMVLLPQDAARYWQLPTAAGHEDLFELGTNIFQYSLDRKLSTKGNTYIVLPDASVKPTRKISVARLQVGANWNPEPGGWPRLAAILRNSQKIDLSVFNVRPGEGALAGAQVAHLTGTTDFTLDDAARLELKTFVKNGGTLVIDAAGGSIQLADAAEQELKKLFPEEASALDRPLSRRSPVYNLPDHKIDQFLYRDWARLNSVGQLKEPRVRGIEIGNRTAVFFSREDLSAGLVGEPVDGIIGYTPETATQIMQGILLYSAPVEVKRPTTSSQPTTRPTR